MVAKNLNEGQLRSDLIRLYRNYLNNERDNTTINRMKKLYLEYNSADVLLSEDLRRAIGLLVNLGWRLDEVSEMPKTSKEEIKKIIKDLTNKNVNSST